MATCRAKENFNNNKNNNKGLISNKSNVVQIEEIIAAVVCEAHSVTKKKGWVVDSACIRHIGAFKEEFSSYTPMAAGTECVYIRDNRSVLMSDEGKVLLNLTSGKTFSLNNVLHVPHFRHNLISVHMLGKVGIKVSFAGGIVTLTKNEVFVGKGYDDEVSLYLMLIKLLIKMVHLLVLT